VIVCICRKIYDEDFENEEELKTRIMQEDFKCGQCQLYYELMENKDE
jgi:hypothetical protein